MRGAGLRRRDAAGSFPGGSVHQNPVLFKLQEATERRQHRCTCGGRNRDVVREKNQLQSGDMRGRHLQQAATDPQPIHGAGPPASCFTHWTSCFPLPASLTGLPAFHFLLPTSLTGLPTSHFLFHLLDFLLPTSYFLSASLTGV